MEIKAITVEPTSIDDQTRTVVGLASIAGVWDECYPRPDRVVQGAFEKTIRQRGPAGARKIRLLWNHTNFDPPTAVIRALREVGRAELPAGVLKTAPDATGGLEVTRSYLTDPESDRIYQGLKSGAITEMSIGYDSLRDKPEPLEGTTGRNLLEISLWELSDVLWGANPHTRAAKAAIPYADRGKAEESETWKKPVLGDFTDKGWEELDDTEKRRIAAHFAWSENMPPESFGDLKFPHHLAAKSGVGPAVWNGARSAMGVLMGAMGGADVPEGDRRGIYTHLEKHYAAFDKPAPDYKMIRLALVLDECLAPEGLTINEAHLLNDEHKGRLTHALEAVREILASAGPLPEEDRASADLVRIRLQLRERGLKIQSLTR